MTAMTRPSTTERARRAPLRLFAAALAATLAACSLAPEYQVPEVPVAEQYREAGGPWTPAQPADRQARAPWWQAYGDAQLSALIERLQQSSPDLAGALARYEQAESFREQARSGLFPRLGIGAGFQRDRQSEHRPPVGMVGDRYYNSSSASVSASYELDLWGRLRNAVTAGEASLQAAEGDLESLRLSLQAQLADAYIQLRATDAEARLLDDTVEAFGKAVELTETRRAAGISSGLDVARAQTQLQTAKVEAAKLRAARAQLEHAIAVLVGESPSRFSIAAEAVDIRQPEVPPGLPSTLLQRRPDIAAAERRAAAANAGIGIARAAWFPSFTIGAAAGYQTYENHDWFTAPNSFWTLGPSLALTLFDGGARRAQLKRAQAGFDAASADYRATALSAFAEVEDQLARLHHYRDATVEENGAAEAAQRALDYAMTRYRAGAVNYLEVVTAQTAALQTQRGLVELKAQQLRASVALIRALGGGWPAATTTASAAMTGAGDASP